MTNIVDSYNVEDTSYQMTIGNKIVDAHPALCGDAFKHKGWVHMMNDARASSRYNVYVTECGFIRASRDIETGDERVYQIVGESETDVENGRVSVVSPLARALIGREVGDETKVPGKGGPRVVEITDVEFK